MIVFLLTLLFLVLSQLLVLLILDLLLYFYAPGCEDIFIISYAAISTEECY